MARWTHLFGRRAGSLARADNGVTAVETAIVLPIFLLLVMGVFDIGYLMYNRAMLNGLVAKAARDSTIESNIGDASMLIDKEVRDMLLLGSSQAKVDFSRQSFSNFTQAAQPEPFSDGNGNNKCDKGEAFEDQNGNKIWDNGGMSGQGSAKDVVVYKVELSYPRLLPLHGLIGLDDEVNLSAQTVVANQPYTSQKQRSVSIEYCR